MPKIKVSSTFTNLCKKGLGVGLAFVMAGTLAGCGNDNYTTNIEDTTTITTTTDDIKTQYTQEELANIELWLVEKTNENTEAMLISIGTGSTGLLLGSQNYASIDELLSSENLAFYSEPMPWDGDLEEINANLTAKAVEEFEQKIGKIQSRTNLYSLLVEKYGEKAGYSLEEIKKIKEETNTKKEAETEVTTTQPEEIELPEQQNTIYDWTNTVDILKENNKVVGMMYIAPDDNSTLSQNKYACAIVYNEEKNEAFRTSEFFRIVDNEGNFLNDIEYIDAYRLDDNSIILQTELREDIYSEIEYTILDQRTGEIRKTTGQLITPCNGYYRNICYDKNINTGTISRCNYLYTKNGDLVGSYEDITIDYTKKYIYLTDDNRTEILNTKTNETYKKTIEGTVTDAENGYIVLEMKTVEDENTSGVYYLSEFDSNLIEIIPQEHKSIEIISSDTDNPLFAITGPEGSEDYLVDKNNEKVIDEEYDYFIKDHQSNTIQAFRINDYGIESTSYFDLYDEQGNILTEDAFYNRFIVIPGTKTAVYQFEEGNHYGILSFENQIREYIMPAEFDRMTFKSFSYKTADGSESENVFIIGRKEATDETIIYTSDLKEVDRGDFDIYEAHDLCSNYSREMNGAKTLTKERQQ